MRSLASFVYLTAVSVAGMGCSLVIDPNPAPFRVDAGSGGSGQDAGTGVDSGGPAIDSGVVRPDVGAVCVEGTQFCEGGDRVVCSGGVLVTEPCPVVCSGGECTDFRPSNVPKELFDNFAPSLIVDDDDDVYFIDTSSCFAPGAETEFATQTSGDEFFACVLKVDELRVERDSRLRAGGDLPLIILARGEVLIEGTIDVSARGILAGPGGFEGGNRGRLDGEGLAPGLGGGERRAFFDDNHSGGGGGGLCGTGGAGGNAGELPGGAGGGAVSSTWELEPLLGGSGGGTGRPNDFPEDEGFAFGGGGGGGVQISARGSIRLRGSIVAGGGGGRGGDDAGDELGSGGGGGSGGAVLLEAPSVEFDGGSIRAAGGGGGASTSGIGGAGQDGFDARLGRATGGQPGFRGGTEGGASGGGSVLSGETGGAASVNAGGGGGGAGCVVVRTATQTVLGGAQVNPLIVPGYRVFGLHAP